MLINQRILFDDNGTESDLSVSLNAFREETEVLALTAAEDYLYVGSILPFNHRFIDVSVVNDQASVVSVDLWWNNAWNNAVDVIDMTAAAGVTLAQSGIIQWKPDRLEGWDRELDSEDVTGITAVGLYDMYWARFSFSGDLKNTTALNYVGQKYSDDTELKTFYADLGNSELMGDYESGKTDWNDQHFMAADAIASDLLKQNVIKSRSQILDYEKFKVASIHKVAEIVYNGLGRAYEDNRKAALEYYKNEMATQFYNVDKDGDAKLSDRERGQSSRYMSR